MVAACDRHAVGAEEEGERYPGGHMIAVRETVPRHSGDRQAERNRKHEGRDPVARRRMRLNCSHKTLSPAFNIPKTILNHEDSHCVRQLSHTARTECTHIRRRFGAYASVASNVLRVWSQGCAIRICAAARYLNPLPQCIIDRQALIMAAYPFPNSAHGILLKDSDYPCAIG